MQHHNNMNTAMQESKSMDMKEDIFFTDSIYDIFFAIVVIMRRQLIFQDLKVE